MLRPLLHLAMLLLLVLSGCHTGRYLMVTGRRIPSSSSAPEIHGVADLGAPQLASTGIITGDQGDGVAAVGELVLVSGDDFGRSLRVTVDGRPAEQIARTADGGVVVRVPWGVRTGRRAFAVKNAEGESSRPYRIRRYALATVPSADLIHVLTVTRAGMKPFGRPLPLPNAHRIRYCADGQIAYVSGQDGDRLVIASIDMAAPGGPHIIGQHELPGSRMIAITAAEQTPVAIAMSDTHVAFFDTRDPRQPLRYAPQPLPAQLAGHMVAADMNPRGTLLAALVDGHNRVILYDVSRTNELKKLAETRVLPLSRAPILKDLRFSWDSQTLWVVSGDNEQSFRRGRVPLRLTGMKLQLAEAGKSRSFGALSIWRTLEVPHQAAPVSLAVARGQPTAAGRTVRVPPENAAIFITAHDSRLLRLGRMRLDRRRGLRRAAQLIKGTAPLGTLLRTGVSGEGGPIFTSPALLGALDITSDSQILLIAGARVETEPKPAALELVYGLTSYRVFGKSQPAFLPLARINPEHLTRPFQLGDVRIQP